MTIDLLIAVAKRVPVVLDEGRRHGWIAKPWMAGGIGRCSIGDITACCLGTIMVTLFGSLGIGRRGWWRWVKRGRLWMRTSCQCEGKQ